MADMTNLSSELDAVNVILTGIGENPVSALDDTTADAANAYALLQEISREVQMVGWHFNTDKRVELTPAADGTITLPPNVVAVRKERREWHIDTVLRGNQLYDRKNKTYSFKYPVKADITYLLPWTQLPESARRFITVRTARVFHDRFVGDTQGHGFSAEDETAAKMGLAAMDLDEAENNLFAGNPLAFYGLSRR